MRIIAAVLCSALALSAVAADDAKSPDFILAHADRATAADLFLASAAMLQGGRVQDAAFLFYAAQMRRRLDIAHFPPKESGGDSPDVALMALSQQIGQAVNPAIMRQPKDLSAAIERVRAWTPITPKSYDPGWKFLRRENDAAAQSAFEANRKDFLDHFGPIATLLNRPDYFAAFKIVQDYNFSNFEEMRKPSRIREKDAAEKKMAAIEKDLGIEGLYYRRSSN
jgi:hypothetical protein